MSSRDDIDAYLFRCLVPMGMMEWTVRYIGRKEVADDEMACVSHTAARRGWISLNSDFWELPEPEQRKIIAHELIHLKAKWWSEIGGAVVKKLKRGDRDAWKDLFELAEEHTVEGLAGPLAAMLPKFTLKEPEDIGEDEDE